MLGRGDEALVETIIHELVHATLFLESQPEFNESVARFIAQEGSVQFAASGRANPERGAASPVDVAHARRRIEESRMIDDALLRLRMRVSELYASDEDPARWGDRRARLEADARVELAALPLTRHDPESLAADIRLGDACLALRSTYTADTGRHAAVLEALGGDLRAFVERLRGAAKHDDPQTAFFETLAKRP
jgi:predicted aminopeptidase